MRQAKPPISANLSLRISNGVCGARIFACHVGTFQKARECATCIPRPNIAKILRGNTPPESGKKASFLPPETLPKGPPIARADAWRVQFGAPRSTRTGPAIFFSLRNHTRFHPDCLDIGGNALPLFLASDPVVARFPLPERLTSSPQHPVGAVRCVAFQRLQ